jgi:hypothetical protein
VGLYTGTSKLKWSFWTSHRWELLIDMLSKSSRNLSTRTNGSSGLQICNNQSMIKMDPNKQPPENQSKTQEKKGKGKTKNDTGKWCDFHKIPWHNTDECRSKQSLVVEIKEKDRTQIQNLIQKIMEGDRSSTQTPLPLSQPQQSNQKHQQILKRGSASSIHRCG